MTGGVARFAAVRAVIASKLAAEFRPFSHDPMLAAAIGAAILGGGEDA